MLALRTCLVCILITCLELANAQQQGPFFHHVSVEQGLNNQTVGFIHRSRDGYIWIGTMFGLSRFDGYEVKTYPDPGNPRHKQVSGLSIQGPILEDSKGNIWFCTEKALHYLDLLTDSIHMYTLKGEHGESLQSEYHLFGLYQDHYLLIRQSQKVFLLDFRNQRQQLLIRDFPYQWAAFIPGGEKRNAYIAGFRPLQGRGMSLYPLPRAISASDELEPAPGFPMQQVRMTRNSCMQGQDSVWFCSDGGVYLLRPGQGSLEFIPDGEKPSLNKYHAIAVMPNGNLALGTRDKGIFYLDWRRHKLSVPISHEDRFDWSLASNSIFSMEIDSSSILWVGNLFSGLNFADLSPYKFSKLPPVPGAATKIRSELSDIVYLPTGEIWIAHENGLLAAYDPRKGAYRDLSALNAKIQRLNGHNIRSIQRDPMGMLWIATENAVFQIDAACRQIIPKFKTAAGNEILQLKLIENGFFYCILKNGEIVRFRPEAGSIKPRTQVFRDENQTYFKLFADDLGSYFGLFSTSYLDEFVFSPSGAVNRKRRLPINYIVHGILYDPYRMKHWIATGAGLCYLGENDSQISPPVQIPGMPSGSIECIRMDIKKRLWFSSFDRIYRYDPDLDQVIRFGNSDGLVCSNNAVDIAVSTGDRLFLFGASDKVFICDPLRIRPSSTYAKPVIKYIQVNDSLLSFAQVQVDQEHRFRFNQNSFTFAFSNLHFSDPKGNQVRYHLAGYDPGWIRAAAPNGEARYPRLPPGQYVFKIQAANSNQVWNPQELSYAFTIDPPYWETRWFRSLAVILILALIYAIIRIYIRISLQQKNMELREHRMELDKERAVQDERNRIASEMHDDLGSGLSSMRFLSERVKTQVEDPHIHHTLDRIANYANALVGNMDEIVWALNTRFDSLLGLLSYTRHHAVEYLDEHKIDCQFTLLDEVPDWVVSGIVRRNIFLVVKEALHNIVKHANASEVHVDVSWLESRLEIGIRDNGQGLSGEASDFGNGLHNMRKRIEHIGGSFRIESGSGGTSIFIEIPKASLSTLLPSA